MKTTVAVLQYNVPFSTDESFEKLEKIVGRAVDKGAKLIVAPETGVGNAAEAKKTKADYLPRLGQLTKKYQVYLATSYYKIEGGELYNQGYIVGPGGNPVVSHKKIYPAKPEVDEHNLKSGNTLETKKTELGVLGMLVCKDSFNRYSHFLFEKLGKLGTDITCIPTWSIGWKKALGVSNEEYVRAFCVYGAFLSRSYVLVSGNLNEEFDSFGRSLIISPVRGVLREGSRDKEEVLVETLELDVVPRAREFDAWWQPQERLI